MSAKLTKEEVDAGVQRMLEVARRRIRERKEVEEEEKKKEKAAKDGGNKGKITVSEAVMRAVKEAGRKGKEKDAERKKEETLGSVASERECIRRGLVVV